MLYETKFLISLLFTLFIEIFVLFFILKFVFRIKKSPIPKIIFSGVVASTLTLPYFWFVLPSYVLSNNYLLVGEFLVFVVETFIYKQILEIKFNQCLIVSFFCNLFSFVFGLAWSNLFF